MHLQKLQSLVICSVKAFISPTWSPNLPITVVPQDPIILVWFCFVMLPLEICKYHFWTFFVKSNSLRFFFCIGTRGTRLITSKNYQLVNIPLKVWVKRLQIPQKKLKSTALKFLMVKAPNRKELRKPICYTMNTSFMTWPKSIASTSWNWSLITNFEPQDEE